MYQNGEPKQGKCSGECPLDHGGWCCPRLLRVDARNNGPTSQIHVSEETTLSGPKCLHHCFTLQFWRTLTHRNRFIQNNMWNSLSACLHKAILPPERRRDFILVLNLGRTCKFLSHKGRKYIQSKYNSKMIRIRYNEVL